LPDRIACETGALRDGQGLRTAPAQPAAAATISRVRSLNPHSRLATFSG
jgi:hypothetical protein